MSILISLLGAVPAHALDVLVSSTTSTQVYDVRTGRIDLFLHRRRVTERLTLRLDRVLPDEDEPGYEGPRMSFVFALRLDTDFGDSSREISPSSDLWYIPGFDPYAVDLVTAELAVRDLFRGTTDVRAGRLVTFDPTGFSALDGLELRVRILRWAEVWAAAGVEVVSGERLSSGGFEVDGVVRVRRDGLDPEEHREVEEPPTRVVVAAGASLIRLDWMTLDLAYRQGIVPGDESRTSYQRLAGDFTFTAGPVDGGAAAGGDIALGLVDEVSAEVGVRPIRWMRLSLGGRYDAPVFDTDSIFVAFWSEPAVEGELDVELRPLDRLVFGATGYVRDVSVFADDSGDPSSLGYGGAIYTRLRYRWLMGEVRARLGEGFGGQRVGVVWRIVASIPRAHLGLDFRGTLLGLREDIPPHGNRVSFGYVVGARYQMSPEAAVVFELEHNGSHDLGHQLRFLALLDLGFWL